MTVEALQEGQTRSIRYETTCPACSPPHGAIRGRATGSSRFLGIWDAPRIPTPLQRFRLCGP